MLAKRCGDSRITYYCAHSFHNHSCFHVVGLLHSHCGTARADPGHTLRTLALVLNRGMLCCAPLHDPPAPSLFLRLSTALSDPHRSPAVPHHPPAALHVGWVWRAVLAHVNQIRQESRYVQNTSQPLAETSASKPRGTASDSFKTPAHWGSLLWEDWLHIIQNKNAKPWNIGCRDCGTNCLYLLCLIICSWGQSHTIPYRLVRLKQMAYPVIKLLYQKDKEKAFNLLLLHRGRSRSGYSSGMEPPLTNGKMTTQWAKITQKQLGHFTLVTVCQS